MAKVKGTAQKVDKVEVQHEKSSGKRFPFAPLFAHKPSQQQPPFNTLSALTPTPLPPSTLGRQHLPVTLNDQKGFYMTEAPTILILRSPQT